MFSSHCTYAELVRLFRTTQSLMVACVMLGGPLNVSLTMSPRLNDQNQPTSHPLMNPRLAMTVELADGKMKMVVLGAVAFAEGPSDSSATATTLRVRNPRRRPVALITRTPPLPSGTTSV